jgi:hypothetical protein
MPKATTPLSAPYKSALDRIDAFLEATNPDLEDEKVEQAMILLFGEPPDVRDYGLSQIPPSTAALCHKPHTPPP